MAIKKCYFASANTCKGFVSFFDYVINDAKRVYIIKGGPGCGKSTFIKKMGEELLEFGFDIDFIYSPSDMNSIDGIFIHGVDFAVVDGTSPHVIDPKYPGAVERILNFGDYWDIDYLREKMDEIKYYFDEIEKHYEVFFNYMLGAKQIHDRWEKEYLKGMDFKKADEITEKLISSIILKNNNKAPKEWHRFAGAMTPQGQLSFYDVLVKQIKNRYIIKGRPGTGKSTMTKKVAKAALKSGYDVEYYHCSFDPDSIDMIIIPELSFAMLDGTAPHEFEPENKDKVIDMFECIDKDIVHEDEDPIKSIELEYIKELEKAKFIYRKIYELNNELEKYYIDAIDFNDVNALRIRITDTIKALKK
ncbi:hypothetical protein FDN13_12520 [Caloramator sp. E03]|uniref:PRK06851 family protein n=1 Tax=Caloramator sp. E03 TaxID=2576307 RepID=UPI001110F69C|nr:PRK06851 family protein [Caloramator sp. E03]QCX34457.1 hypothetical protein FDN13_12520 [Caloramator sp. E03]